ncbi:MAG: glycosyltransferase family 9 protein [Ichthyobacteriaceae bacterium]|nr:glycosyltransferase family 9 protein [Ichthyobacteriaceae bacterium]
MNVLVIRMSAMGDVAMTVPVIKAALELNKDLNITFVSRLNFKVFFDGIDRLDYIAPDLNGKHKGVSGLYKFFQDLKKIRKFDAVADLHGVLRSKVISSFFAMTGIKVASIEKGKSEKKQLTAKNKKELKPLKHSTERYADVLRELGLTVKLSHKLPVKDESRKIPAIIANETGVKAGQWIGIAPFAQHKGKKYPLDKIEELIIGLTKNYPKSKLFLFGGGRAEIELLTELWHKYPQVILAAGKMDLGKELDLISNMDLMIAMDSANMHMASLVGTKVVSVWGATHPFTGFMGYGQSEKLAAQINMNCRPCSVFGDKDCYKTTYECLEKIPVSLIVDKVKEA